MKFKMSEKSLFATLLRAPWWVSFLVMFAVALVAGALLPEAYKTAGMLGAFPFFVIGVMAAWRQRNAISASRIQELVEQARGMGWRDFSVLVEEALRQQGFVVTRMADGPADFQIEKNSRITLVSAKRWKAATLGVEPLRELVALRDELEASNCVFITLGQVSAKAQEYAAQNRITLIADADVVALTAKTIKIL